MFRNVFAFVVIASAALAFTGCSKCSQQPAVEAPAAVEETAPVEGAVEAPADAATEAAPAEVAPEATPAE